MWLSTMKRRWLTGLCQISWSPLPWRMNVQPLERSNALTRGCSLRPSRDACVLGALSPDFERYFAGTGGQQPILHEKLRNDDFELLDQRLECLGTRREPRHVLARSHPD